MTLSLAFIRSTDGPGRLRTVEVDITFDASYPTGGEAITGRQLGMRTGALDSILFTGGEGMDFRYVPTDAKSGTIKAMRNALANAAFSNPGLAIGSGSKAKVLIANTVQYAVAGALKTKTTAEVAFTATTHDIPPHASLVQEAVYAYSLQADGDVTVTMGAIASGAGAALFPAHPAGETLIGYLRLAVAAGATPFDATTDELDEAHLTDTYYSQNLPPDGVTGIAEGASEVGSTADLSGITVRALARGR